MLPAPDLELEEDAQTEQRLVGEAVIEPVETNFETPACEGADEVKIGDTSTISNPDDQLAVPAVLTSADKESSTVGLETQQKPQSEKPFEAQLESPLKTFTEPAPIAASNVTLRRSPRLAATGVVSGEAVEKRSETPSLLAPLVSTPPSLTEADKEDHGVEVLNQATGDERELLKSFDDLIGTAELEGVGFADLPHQECDNESEATQLRQRSAGRGFLRPESRPSSAQGGSQSQFSADSYTTESDDGWREQDGLDLRDEIRSVEAQIQLLKDEKVATSEQIEELTQANTERTQQLAELAEQLDDLKLRYYWLRAVIILWKP